MIYGRRIPKNPGDEDLHLSPKVRFSTKQTTLTDSPKTRQRYPKSPISSSASMYQISVNGRRRQNGGVDLIDFQVTVPSAFIAMANFFLHQPEIVFRFLPRVFPAMHQTVSQSIFQSVQNLSHPFGVFRTLAVKIRLRNSLLQMNSPSLCLLMASIQTNLQPATCLFQNCQLWESPSRKRRFTLEPIGPPSI